MNQPARDVRKIHGILVRNHTALRTLLFFYCGSGIWCCVDISVIVAFSKVNWCL